jgi:hypothetical protein
MAGMVSAHETLQVGDDLKEWVHSLFETSGWVDTDFWALVTILERSKLD